MEKRKEQPQLVKELTPELADKIINAFKRKQYNDRASKDALLHHLKQLKAQMGKFKKNLLFHEQYDAVRRDAVTVCMEMIDSKISKINSTNP